MPILKNTGHIRNNFSGFASHAPRRQHRGQEPKNGSRRQDGRRDEQRAGRTNSEPAGRAAGRQDERQDERRAGGTSGGTGCGRTAGRQDGKTAGRQDGRTAGRQDGMQRDEMSRVRRQDSTGAWNAPPPGGSFPEQQPPIPHLAGGLRRPHNNAPDHGKSGAKRWRGGRQAGGGPAQRTAGRCNKGSAAGRRGENGRHPGRLRR